MLIARITWCDLCDQCEQPANLRGGDGSGGAYNWSQMPLDPDCSTTLAQRQAIGALTYDAGVAVGMDYESDGSGAYMSDAAAAMVNTFGYSNAIMGGDEIDNIGDGLNGMINPNLDSGNPVILGIDDSQGDGHAVVADGYGYQSSTLYHHLNMGWDGDDDVWYNLPNIDALSIDPSAYSFNVVDSVIYNIYISGTGEIISGRVTAADSKTPVSGATVTAVRTGGGTYQTTTNTNGIYAFANVPSNSTYTISVAKAGHSFADQATNTGQSQDDMATSGNCWAVDFVPTVIIGKCTVSAGSNNNDTISFSGTLSATIDDISAATEIVVDINSADMAGHFVQSFPVNSTTFKNGKFNCTITSNPFKASFALNTNTSKFSFTAKNVDLLGLSCPLTALIEIGGYNAETDINEAIVNGKKPIPISLLMGVKDSLRVDKIQVKPGRTYDQLIAKGVFSIAGESMDMANINVFVTLGPRIFMIPAYNFKFSKGKYSCVNVNLFDGGTIGAVFDFNAYTFVVTITHHSIKDYSGLVNLGIDCTGFSADTEVAVP